jgi:hypothetical protein
VTSAGGHLDVLRWARAHGCECARGRDGFRGGSCGESSHAGGSEATLEARVKCWRYFLETGPTVLTLYACEQTFTYI